MITSINQTSGVIVLQLRNALGRGDKPVYTVAITTTDASGNASASKVEIRAMDRMGSKRRAGK